MFNGAIGVLIVIVIMRGWLIPKATVDAERENHLSQIQLMQNLLEESNKEKEQWRLAWTKAEEGRSIAASQGDELLDGLRTVEAVLRALPRYTGGENRGTSPNEGT